MKETFYTGRNGSIRVMMRAEVRGAKFSADKKYRYRLWRIWDKSKPLAMCIGINPSTANEDKDDPTIVNIRKMLTKLGYGGFYMMNLFAFISSEPSDLLTCEEPIGDNNDDELRKIRDKCSDVIYCWGSGKKVKGFKPFKNRIETIGFVFDKPKCFGYNLDGTPCHPLSMMYAGKTDKPELINYKNGDKQNNNRKKPS